MNNAVAIAGYASLAIGSILTIFSRIPKQTITNQKDLIEAQEKRIKGLEDQKEADHKTQLENVRAIADLQGQIKVYKELPLQEMAGAMKDISEVNRGIAASNQEILKTLRNSALIAAEDKKDLMGNQVIQEQHVEHQTIESKVDK